MDFPLDYVLSELFLLGVTAEALRLPFPAFDCK